MIGTQFLLYGDSRTSSSGQLFTTPLGGSASSSAYGYAAWLESYSGGQALVPANGDYAITTTTQSWQARVDAMIASPVQNVILMLGHNYAAYSSTVPNITQMKADIENILQQLVAAGKQVFMVTELPINYDDVLLDQIHQWEDDPNGATAGIASSVHVINIWDDFLDPANPSANVINPALTYDGVHLNAAGNQIFGQDLANYLAPYLTGGDGILLPTSTADAFNATTNRGGVLLSNFMMTGTTGTIGAGTTGTLATGWTSATRNTAGLTISLSQATDSNGIPEQVINVTGTPTQAGGSLTLTLITNIASGSIPIGDNLRAAIMVDYPSTSSGIFNISPSYFVRYSDGSLVLARGTAGSQYAITAGFDMPFVIPDLLVTGNITQIIYTVTISFAANTPVNATLDLSQAEVRDITRVPGANPPPVIMSTTTVHSVMDHSLTVASSQLLKTAIDPDGYAMSVSSVTALNGGTASIVNGDVVFTPTEGFHGQATVSYTVTDTNGGSINSYLYVNIPAPEATGLDFNGDGVGDVLFSTSSNTFAIWELSTAGAIIGGGSLGTPGTNYTLVGTGDFNGDAKTDLLFRDTSGVLSTWTLNGTTLTGGGIIGNPGASVALEGTGDFNGDGYTDLLLRNSVTGAITSWDLKGTSTIGGGALGNPGASVIVKATGDFNGDGKTDILFETAAGSYAIWNMNDTKVASSEVLGNPGANWFFKGVGDFNGDQITDILFEDTSGNYAYWQLSGTAVSGGGTIGNPGPGWTLVGIGDYNGDTVSDLLFQNTSGALAVWTLNGTTITGGMSLGNPGSTYEAWHGTVPDFAHLVFQDASTGVLTGWDVGLGQQVATGTIGTPAGLTALATGDFAATGETDVLLQDASGNLSYWSTNGLAQVGSAAIGNPGAGETFVALGDFKGDGHSDILFQDASGALSTWDMSGSQIVGGGTIGTAAGFTVIGTADLNGDGKSDILFKDNAGNLAVWLMNDTTIIGGGMIGNPGGTWAYKGSGDFNGDGKSDLLFEDASGNYAVWDMNGSTIIGGGAIGNPGIGWTLVKIADVNQDGKADLVFEDASGHLATWLMSDTTIIGGTTIATVSSNQHVI